MNYQIWMKAIPVYFVVMVVWLLLMGKSSNDAESEMSAAIKTMTPEDSLLLREQKFCAVHITHRLGICGVPYKIEISGKPMFVCCKSCEKQAISNPDRTLRNVEQMKTNSARLTRLKHAETKYKLA